jgi:hypothetical protein
LNFRAGVQTSTTWLVEVAETAITLNGKKEGQDQDDGQGRDPLTIS